MKLTYEQKVQIYHDWKSNRMSVTELAEHYHIALSNIKYLVELADRHGVSADCCIVCETSASKSIMELVLHRKL